MGARSAAESGLPAAMLNTPAGSPSMPTSIRVTMPSPSRPLTADSDVTLPSPAAAIASRTLGPASGPNCATSFFTFTYVTVESRSTGSCFRSAVSQAGGEPRARWRIPSSEPSPTPINR